MGRSASLALLSAIALLAACQRDPRDPLVNRRPVRPIRVIVQNRSGIPFVLSAFYQAGGTTRRCMDRDGSGRPAYVEIPIRLKPIVRPAWEGQIFGDRYLEGACRWTLGAIFVTVKRKDDRGPFDMARNSLWAVGFGQGPQSRGQTIISNPTLFSTARCDAVAGACTFVETPWVVDGWGGEPDTVLIYLEPA